MTLTVLLRSRSALKVLGSVIDTALARGHDVGLEVEANAKEPWQPGDLDRWRTLRRYRAGVAIGLATYLDADVGVPFWWDNLLLPSIPGQVTGYLSAWHRDMHARNFPMDRRVIQQQPIIGWTMADHRALLPPGLPGPPTALLFTMKRLDPARRRLVARLRYFHAVRDAATYARLKDLAFTIKTRPKHRDPWWLGHFGRVVGETCMYPSTSLQLLQHTWEATTFTSGAVLEARLFPWIKLVDHRVPLGRLATLPGVAASYDHMRHDPLDRIITYTDCRAGERVVDLAEGVQ